MSAVTPRSGRQTRFIFVRHGAAVDVDGRCIGHTDVALSSHGADAIRALVNDNHGAWPSGTQSLNGVRVVSSDLHRARDSATIIADALGVSVLIDPRLREASFGEWDGRRWSDVERSDGERLRAWMEQWSSGGRPPGGESVDDLARRVDDWLADTLSAPDDGADLYVVVAHAGSIRAAVCRLQRRPLERMFDVQIEHAHAIVIDYPAD
jgi:broad specificity phosphatase PhoE